MNIWRKNMNKTYAYVRVSSRDQNEERQVAAMQLFGVNPKNIVIEKQSGKDFNRPLYLRLVQKLKADDILVIKSIDRLGRNYDEILEQWRILTKEKHVDIVVLDMPLLDTRKGKDLTGTLIADIVLQLLSYVAQTEREFIRQRQREGIEIARANGVHFGRKAMVRPSNYDAVKSSWLCGELSGRGAAKLLGVSHTTFNNWVHNDHQSQNGTLYENYVPKKKLC